MNRKVSIFFAFILVVTLFTLMQSAYAQVSYQFQENKGQWDSVVQYRSRIPGGYVYLRKTGFTYSLLDQKDMTALDHYVHGAPSQQEAEGDSSYVIGPGHQRGQNSRTSQSSDASFQPINEIHAFAYRVNFENANPDVQLVPDHPYPTRYNYFLGNDPSRWAGNVREFGGVTYKNLYKNIDARVYAVSSGLKYDVIAFPGSDPERDIRLHYDGIDKISLKKGHLHITTSLGEVIEAAPYAYQVVKGVKTEIPCRYKLDGKEVRFKISGKYDPAYPLIIDPRLIFATFSGSTADNWGYTATYDAAGNFYMGGIVFGTGYPVTTGAYQINFQGGGGGSQEGGFDISISKFSPDGKKLIYATYLGGSGNEQPQSLIVDKQGNLIISGRTSDWGSYPKVGDSGKVGPCGGAWDIILTELNATGSALVGSMTIGGTGSDGANIADKYTQVNGKFTTSLRRFYGDDARSEVNIDGAGNIVLVGCTQSADFPVRPNKGAVFQGTLGGQQDGIVLKAKPDLSEVIWSSFLGGSANDAAYVINFSKNGDLYVAGGTESSNFPGNKTNVKQPSYAGRVDGFIAEIKDDGSQIIRSTYLGTDQADQIYGIQTDTAGNVYVGGTTEGVWEVTDNAKYPGINLNGKQFLCKLKPDLSAYLYSTVFGSSNSQPASLPNISPTAFLVDRCQNVYMAGWGGSISNEYLNAGTNDMPTVNALNPRPPDGRDFYFFVLKKDAARILFASTYGQNGGFTDHVDGGTSRFDPTGVIYEAICANCGGGTTFPTGPPGVYSRQNGSKKPNSQEAGCNEVALKIAFDLDGVRGGVATTDRRKIYCNGDEIAFIDTLFGRKADSWTWDIYNSWDSTQFDLTHRIAQAGQDSTMQKPYEYHYVFGTAGYYTVRLVKYKKGDCIEYDTSYLRLKIGDNPAYLKAEVHKLRPCNSYKYAFVNNSSNAKNVPFSDTAFLWNFGDGSPLVVANKDTVLVHQFPGEGNYTITLTLQDTASFCNVPLDTTINISISNHLKAIIQAPDTICIPNLYLLGNASQGGTNFIWAITTPQGVTDSFHLNDLSQLPYNFNEPGEYKVELFAQDTVCGTQDYAVDTVFAYPRPAAAFLLTPDNATNQVITFTNLSQSNFDSVDNTLHYIWYFGDGNTSTEKNPQHLYVQTGTYLVQLVTYNNAGCSDTASMEVTETIIPKLDMPNAFTPNGDGRNDYFGPRAFGVSKIDFRIYNRWGQLVFQSNDPEIAYMQNKGWDGTFKNKPQPVDVYAYTLHIIFNDGTEATRQGSVTLIR